ncbi:hypothetical protein FA15DRAFT_676551, partial [Coprinopsis marcescibilis]
MSTSIQHLIHSSPSSESTLGGAQANDGDSKPEPMPPPTCISHVHLFDELR